MSDFRPYPKPSPVIKAKKPLKKSYKPTGELALFREIARARPHVSFVSGDKITDLQPINFAHVLSKGAHSEMRLESDNIVLLTADEHTASHSLDREGLLKLDVRWQKFFDLAEKLKSELIERK